MDTRALAAQIVRQPLEVGRLMPQSMDEYDFGLLIHSVSLRLETQLAVSIRTQEPDIELADRLQCCWYYILPAGQCLTCGRLSSDGRGSLSEQTCVVQNAVPVAQDASCSLVQREISPAGGSNAQFYNQP
jgi:hypothetical protein